MDAPSVHITCNMFSVVLYLLILCASLCGKEAQEPSPLCQLRSNKPTFEYKYYQDGDFIIGGLFLVSCFFDFVTFYMEPVSRLMCTIPTVKNYADLLTFIFAVDEINGRSDLLPNVTLGYHVFDTCGDDIQSVQNIISILSGEDQEVPNYSCREDAEVLGFVGDTVPMVQLLERYKYSRIHYDSLLRGHRLSKKSFTTAHSEELRYSAIAHIIKKSGWNWVGVMTPLNDEGEKHLQDLSDQLAKNGICIAYVIRLPTMRDTRENLHKFEIMKASKAKILIICGKFLIHYFLLTRVDVIHEKMTLIIDHSWIEALQHGHEIVPFINCSLIISPPPKYIPGLETFLHQVNLNNRPSDPILEDIWYFVFFCNHRNIGKHYQFQEVYELPDKFCHGDEYHITSKLYRSNYTSFYNVYAAVYMFALALHYMIGDTKINKDVSGTSGYSEKIHRYIRRTEYRSRSEGHVIINQDNEKLNIYNWVFHNSTWAPNMDVENPVGQVSKSPSSAEYEVHVNYTAIQWKTGDIPESLCSEKCPVGYRKAFNSKIIICCHDCVMCSEGEISNITDSESCYKCPEDKWPDSKREKCVPKTYDFLSYSADVLTPVFSVLSLSASTGTLLILIIFIYYWDTPIVKSNNRTVSFILLVSILLSFLGVFLFLGRPVDITCKMRQTLFAIFFSTAVSCVLGKTIIVCIAFKATKPGSVWRKWLGATTSTYVVLSCSSVQVLICIIWLTTSPPYLEFDYHTYQGKIIIQCNEGSDIWFYSMLGYLGFLAAVSFVLAFMVRTLPDTFNEAKYITFSMLLFCTVWIAMIPAYLSTKGKYMVVVEIFAILTSCAGVLCCIFLPKCYLLIMKPELNAIKLVAEKNKNLEKQKN